MLGMGLCMLSAIAFGLAPLFAKECFAAGFSVSAMLTGRFGIAALVFWAVVAVRRPALPGPRLLLACLALGGVGYAVQAACYFGALTRIDASLAGEMLYVYPAIVLVLGVALRRERASRRKLAALGCSVSGLVLLLGCAGSNGPVAPAGVLLAFGAALTYALYVTVANGLPADLDVYLLSALVCSSAAVSVGVFGVSSGSLRVPAAGRRLALAAADGPGLQRGLHRLLPGRPAAGRRLDRGDPVLPGAGGHRGLGHRGVRRPDEPGQAIGAAVVLAAVVLLRPAPAGEPVRDESVRRVGPGRGGGPGTRWPSNRPDGTGGAVRRDRRTKTAQRKNGVAARLTPTTLRRCQTYPVSENRNVLGTALEECGTDPVTGFYRDGCCTSGPQDLGSHSVCAVLTSEFLQHQRRWATT